MNKICIYVEGKSDKEFLECYLRYLGKNSESYKVDINENSNIIKENLLNKIKSHKDNEEQVLIIFDADEDFKQTQEGIIKDSENLITDKELFLFPNNQDEGELETLLSDMVKDKKPYECFNRYLECLGDDLCVNVFKKSAMYAYREATGAEKKIKRTKGEKKLEVMRKEFERIFDFETCALKPLKTFIEQFLPN